MKRFIDYAKRLVVRTKAKVLKGKLPEVELVPRASNKAGIMDIMYKGEKVGFIMRGHRSVRAKHQGKGFFAAALKKLEEIDARQIREHGFSKYKEMILDMVEANVVNGHPSYRSLKPLVKGLEEPCFIEYTGLSEPLLRLMENGYGIHPESLKILKQRAGLKNPNRRNLLDYLKTNPKFGSGTYFLLTKSVNLQ